MNGCNGLGINSYALISYLPEPLAGYLDSLRCELVPRCQARTHVTVLPPRPLAAGLPDAANAYEYAAPTVAANDGLSAVNSGAA